ncbi:glyoxalase [Mucilaginibacter terrigena]|uniref:Glyoxalase n=1 Tax=Mucilaginibacter terrigena TaxID=2492395 RepID=A0A4Q5LIK2_9SPHI|nr:VOC family protein [Mucilaginibacter terrigena]RYU87955.1 glyoxalase [Mucilaginibacter terrigena]
MKPRKIWANFSVKDAARTNQFYTQLGLKPNNTNNYPKLASFAFGDDAFVIHFFEEGSQINDFLTTGATNEIIFTLSAETEQEVKEWEEQVKAAGGSIFQQAERDKNGYYGCGFADPDGHKFNILLMEEGM